MSNEKELNCNFCGKSRDNVEKLIAGPNVYICDECISISYDIIQKDPDVEFTELDIKSSTPPEINDFLNEHIIGNTNTKEIITKHNISYVFHNPSRLFYFLFDFLLPFFEKRFVHPTLF